MKNCLLRNTKYLFYFFIYYIHFLIGCNPIYTIGIYYNLLRGLPNISYGYDQCLLTDCINHIKTYGTNIN